MKNAIRVSQTKNGSFRFYTRIDGKTVAVKKDDAFKAVTDNTARFVDTFYKSGVIVIIKIDTDRVVKVQKLNAKQNIFMMTMEDGVFRFKAEVRRGIAMPDWRSEYVRKGHPNTPALQAYAEWAKEYLAREEAAVVNTPDSEAPIDEPVEQNTEVSFDMQAASDNAPEYKEVFRIEAAVDKNCFRFKTSDYDVIVENALAHGDFRYITVEDRFGHLLFYVNPDGTIEPGHLLLAHLGIDGVLCGNTKDTWDNFRTVRDNPTAEMCKIRFKFFANCLMDQFNSETLLTRMAIKHIAEDADRARARIERRYSEVQTFEPRRERFADDDSDDETLPTFFADFVYEEHDAPPANLDDVVDRVTQSFFKLKHADDKYNLGKRAAQFKLAAYNVIAEHAIYKAAIKHGEVDIAAARVDTIKRMLHKIGIELLI